MRMWQPFTISTNLTMVTVNNEIIRKIIYGLGGIPCRTGKLSMASALKGLLIEIKRDFHGNASGDFSVQM